MNEKFRAAFDKFIHDVKQDKLVLAILFFGSAQRNEETDSSDLDFYIIVEGEEGWNYKRYIKDVPIEAYFFNESYWKRIIKENSHAMDAFAWGTIIFDTNDMLKKIKEMAQAIYNEGPKPLSTIEKANWRITLTELLADLNGLHASKDHGIFLGWTVMKALEGYCELTPLWPSKPEKLVAKLKKYDPNLAVYIDKFENKPEIQSARAIIQYVLDQHGGPIKEYEGPRINLSDS